MTDLRGRRVVCVLTTGERGGGEYATVDLLTLLVDLGADVLLLTNDPGLADGTAVPAREIDLGPKLSRRSALRVVTRAPLTARRLRAALVEHGPVDALLLPYKKEQILASLLPASVTGAIIWLEWGPIPRQLASPPASWIYRAAARRPRRVLAVSESTRESLLVAGVTAGKVHVVPPLIEVERVRFDAAARSRLRAAWGVDDATFVVGCVSRLHPTKRVDVVIDAVGRLAPPVMLVVAGEGEDRERLEARAATAGAPVRFLPTPRGHVHEVLSAADVLAFAPGPTEGAPRTIAFGQLTERPVVATGPAGAEMILPGTGVVINPPEDVGALAARLADYRDDPDRRRAEGLKGREAAVRLYAPGAVGAALATALDGALEPPVTER